MSSESQDTKHEVRLPENLPACPCFQTSDEFSWQRSHAVAAVAQAVGTMFHRGTKQEEICPLALPYVLEIALVGMLAYIARAQGPVLEYGSQEIEWESVRLLTGLEARVLARVTEAYAARGRELGLTEASVNAMREAAGETSQ